MCEKELDLITKLTTTERKKILRWIASLPEAKIIEIFQSTVKKFFQIKDQNPSVPGRTKRYAAFILVSCSAGWNTVSGKSYRVAETTQFDDFSNLRKAKVAALIKKGRTPVIRRKVLSYFGEIKELKTEGMGFRPIADYLRRTRKITVSAAYLARLWKEVEENGEI